jgi:hypothetical protein
MLQKVNNTRKGAITMTFSFEAKWAKEVGILGAVIMNMVLTHYSHFLTLSDLYMMLNGIASREEIDLTMGNLIEKGYLHYFEGNHITVGKVLFDKAVRG